MPTKPEELEALVPREVIRRQVTTSLYRLYDKAERLLYVGMSADPVGRIEVHMKTQPWALEVAEARFEWHGTRWHAETAEIIAIKGERPAYNYQHAQGARPIHRLVRDAMDEVRNSADPEQTLRRILRWSGASHHMRQTLTITYLNGTLIPAVSSPARS